MYTIGKRLAEERKRLGYNQTEFGALGGVALRTVIDWEKDKTSPNSAFLAEIAKNGADVLYIITGERKSEETLPPRENALLNNYRHSDEESKKIIEKVAFATAKSKEIEKVTNQNERR